MQRMTITKLRADIYHVVDEVIRTGKPLAIKRHGKTVLISVEGSGQSKLKKLKRHHAIKGSPDELVDLKVYEWHPDL